MLKSGSRTKLLKEYTDACELIKETEKDLERLRRQQDRVHDVVKGSMHEFPYIQTTVHIEGVSDSYSNNRSIRLEEKILLERRKKAEQIKTDVENMINDMPMRMQRIVSMRYIKGMNWEDIAERMGRNASGDSIRKECERYLKEKSL